MTKKIINKDILRTIIRETIENFINEEPALSLKYHENPQANDDLIVEMARLNKKETGNCIFPYASWEVKIWSNDHNPPHFHVIKEGWDVAFTIYEGELFTVKTRGENDSVFEYMCKNVKKWLSTTCSSQKKLTNKENALLLWESLHDE